MTETDSTSKPKRARKPRAPKVPKGFIPVKPIGDLSYRRRRARFLDSVASSLPFQRFQTLAVYEELRARAAKIKSEIASAIEISEVDGKVVEKAA